MCIVGGAVRGRVKLVGGVSCARLGALRNELVAGRAENSRPYSFGFIKRMRACHRYCIKRLSFSERHITRTSHRLFPDLRPRKDRLPGSSPSAELVTIAWSWWQVGHVSEHSGQFVDICSIARS